MPAINHIMLIVIINGIISALMSTPSSALLVITIAPVNGFTIRAALAQSGKTPNGNSRGDKLVRVTPRTETITEIWWIDLRGPVIKRASPETPIAAIIEAK